LSSESTSGSCCNNRNTLSKLSDNRQPQGGGISKKLASF
jgi:hypothetical protein